MSHRYWMVSTSIQVFLLLLIVYYCSKVTEVLDLQIIEKSALEEYLTTIEYLLYAYLLLQYSMFVRDFIPTEQSTKPEHAHRKQSIMVGISLVLGIIVLSSVSRTKSLIQSTEEYPVEVQTVKDSFSLVKSQSLSLFVLTILTSLIVLYIDRECIFNHSKIKSSPTNSKKRVK